jgi:hypothetical protein
MNLNSLPRVPSSHKALAVLPPLRVHQSFFNQPTSPLTHLPHPSPPPHLLLLPQLSLILIHYSLTLPLLPHLPILHSPTCLQLRSKSPQLLPVLLPCPPPFLSTLPPQATDLSLNPKQGPPNPDPFLISPHSFPANILFLPIPVSPFPLNPPNPNGLLP